MHKSTIAKISAVSAALLLCCIAVRAVVAERSSDPSYIMWAGSDCIRQEWGYSTRFDFGGESRSATRQLGNMVNNALFRLCRPVFRLENMIVGKKIVKGDADFDRYMIRVGQLKEKGWDYVISPAPDGRELLAVKNNVIVQELD